jgi:RimJ/RimL family protein N-acetyltransferase
LDSAIRFLQDSGRDPQVMRRALRTVRERMASEQRATGLRRDLTVPHTAPEALVAISIRPLRDSDVPVILETDRDRLTADERWERSVRRRILESGAGTCYVAANQDDEPTYVQWMFTSADNAHVQRHFDGTFPVLEPDTVLLEGAFTPERHRGKRIMSAAMSRIAELGVEHDARYVVTFVGDDNVASLKGCARAGFTPYLARTQNWRLMRQDVRFATV